MSSNSLIGIPSALAVPITSLPNVSPSSNLSPALYTFFIVLIGLIFIGWLVRLSIQAHHVHELWRGVKSYGVVRVEGQGAGQLSREELRAMLRTRVVHQVEDIKQIQVQAHVATNQCKVTRTTVVPANTNSNGEPSSLPSTSIPSSSYELTIPIASIGSIARCEVYVGVPLKLIHQLYHAHEQFQARPINKKEKTRKGNKVIFVEEDHTNSLQSTADTSAAAAPITSDSEERKVQPQRSQINLEIKEQIQLDDVVNDQASVIRAQILQYLETNSYTSLFYSDEYVWKSPSFIVQPPASSKSITASRFSSSSSSTTSSSSSFRQSVVVPIPMTHLQRVCKDVAHQPRPMYPILIHLSTIDALQLTPLDKLSPVSLTNSSHSSTISELTIAESLGSFAVIPETPAPSTFTAGSSPTSPTPLMVEDVFLSKLKFEKQFLLVSSSTTAAPSTTTSNKHLFVSSPSAPTTTPQLAAIYELEDLYGLNAISRLPDPSTATTTSAAKTDTNNDCIVCMSEMKDIILLPCRHVCVCHACHRSLNKCPICRAPEISYMRFVDHSQTVAAMNERKKKINKFQRTKTPTTKPNR